MAVIPLRPACLLLVALLTPACLLPAEDPALSLQVDAVAVRKALLETAPGPAWDDPLGASARLAIRRDLPGLLGLPPDAWSRIDALAGVVTPTEGGIGQVWNVVPAGALSPLPLGWRTTPHSTGELIRRGAIDDQVIPVLGPGGGSGDGVGKAPLRLDWRADALLAAVAAASESPMPERVALAPWAGATGRIDLALHPGPAGWRGTANLHCDRPLPLRAIASTVSCLADDQQAVRLGVAIDPAALALLLDETLPPLAKRGLRDAIGLSHRDLAGRLTGDGYLQCALDGMVPRGTAIILGRPGADLQPIVRGLADTFRGKSTTEVPGGVRLDTPIGPLVLGLAGNRLVVGSDPLQVKAWLAGSTGSAPLAADRSLVAEVDLPALAPFLPLLSAVAWESPRLPGPLDQHGGTLGDLALGRVQAGSSTFGTTLIGEPQTVTRPQGTGSIRFSAGLAVAEALAGGSATAPAVAADLERAFAWYAPAQDPVRRVALVFRSARGWHLLDDWRRGWTKPLNRGAITSRLGAVGCPRAVGGTELDTLTISALPPAISDWIPPLTVLAPRLPAWRVAVIQTQDGAKLEEQGLPLATVGLATACWWAATDLLPRMRAAGSDGFQ